MVRNIYIYIAIPISSFLLLDPNCCIFFLKIKLVKNTLQNIGQQVFDTKYTLNSFELVIFILYLILKDFRPK
jgi:hypothetical protein